MVCWIRILNIYCCFSLLSIETVGVCRERGKYLFWLGSLLCSHFTLLVFTGGIIMVIFYILWSCCLQKLFHLSGMLFSSSWWMVCSFTLLICLFHFIQFTLWCGRKIYCSKSHLTCFGWHLSLDNCKNVSGFNDSHDSFSIFW